MVKRYDLAAFYGEVHVYDHPIKALAALDDPPLRHVAKAGAAMIRNLGPSDQWKFVTGCIPALGDLARSQGFRQ